MINKKCDFCGKLIEQKEDVLGYSEFCLYHFQKRRDFCSKNCFKSFFIKYFEIRDSTEDLIKVVNFITELRIKKEDERDESL